MSKYDISIITVCKNSERTIEKTIQSVLNQSFKNYQYIIIDGMSNDRTLNIIESYRGSFDEDQLMLISEKDSGIYDAMNKGITHSKGKLIGIINSDDWYEKDALKQTWEIYQNNNNKDVIIYGALRYIKSDIEESIRYYRHEFLKERSIAHPSCFVAKSVYNKIGVFDTNYKIVADYDFFLRAYELEIEFIGINNIFANFRLDGISSSSDLVPENLKLKYKHGFVSKREYKWRTFKHWIKGLLKRIEIGNGLNTGSA